MGMTEQHIKEQLSVAYARAVAARAGVLFSKDELDYGTDGTFKEVTTYNIKRNRYNTNGFSIDFQAKASENVIFEDNYLVYDLDADNYNDLVRVDIGMPRILILYVLPEERDEWLNISDNEAIMKRCAWWCSLKGLAPTTNERTRRIRIPRGQIFTPDKLVELLSKVRRGEELS